MEKMNGKISNDDFLTFDTYTERNRHTTCRDMTFDSLHLLKTMLVRVLI